MPLRAEQARQRQRERQPQQRDVVRLSQRRVASGAISERLQPPQVSSAESYIFTSSRSQASTNVSVEAVAAQRAGERDVLGHVRLRRGPSRRRRAASRGGPRCTGRWRTRGRARLPAERVAGTEAVGDRRAHRRVQQPLAVAGAVKARAGGDEVDLVEQARELAHEAGARARVGVEEDDDVAASRHRGPAAARAPCPCARRAAAAPSMTRAPPRGRRRPSRRRSDRRRRGSRVMSGSSRRPSRHGPMRAASSRAGITTLIVCSRRRRWPAFSGARRWRPRARRASRVAVATACAQVNGDGRMRCIVPHDRLASQSKGRAWISTTLPSRRSTARRCAPGSKSTRTRRRSCVAQDEQEAIAARRRWQGVLAEAGLAGVTWPVELGGQGLGPVEQVILNQEILRAGVPGILDVIGHRDARPDDHRPRHRRAEGALPRAAAARRRGLVPAVLRAGGGLGPGGRAGARDAAGATGRGG